MKTLIIEAETDVAEVLNDLLSSSYQNIEVDHANNVQQALTLLRTNDYRLIFSEFQFSDGLFWPILDLVKSKKPQPTFVLLTTAYWDDHPELHQYEFEYVRKPFVPRDLLQIIERHLKDDESAL